MPFPSISICDHGKPVLSADLQWTALESEIPSSYMIVLFRAEQDGDGKYVVLFNAREIDLDGARRTRVGRAHTSDFLHWELCPNPVFEDRAYAASGSAVKLAENR